MEMLGAKIPLVSVKEQNNCDAQREGRWRGCLLCNEKDEELELQIYRAMLMNDSWNDRAQRKLFLKLKG